MRPTPFTDPSMTRDVDPLPQPFLRDDPDRLDDRRVVELVDVVLVREQAMQTGEPQRHLVGRPAVLQEEEHRDADPADGDERSTRPSARARAVRSSPRSRPGSPRPALRARAAGGEARLEKPLDPVRSAERVRHADVAGEDRADGQHDERQRHRRRRVVQMTRDRGRAMRRAGVLGAGCAGAGCRRAAVLAVAVKRQEHQAEHVDRRQQRREQPDHPQHRVAARKGAVQDLVLAEESGQARHAGNRHARRSGTSSR